MSPSGSVPFATSPAYGATSLFDAKSDLAYTGHSMFLPNARYIANRFRFEVAYQTTTFTA